VDAFEVLAVLRHPEVRDDQRQPGMPGEQVGYRSGPRGGPGTGPDPQCVTTGTPVSASSPQTSRSSGSLGSYPPTCRWHLNTRTPWSSARRTSSDALGSAKNVAVRKQSEVRAANCHTFGVSLTSSTQAPRQVAGPTAPRRPPHPSERAIQHAQRGAVGPPLSGGGAGRPGIDIPVALQPTQR
jgi:hypothetical protein